MKKSKILALPLTLIVMFGIYAIPSFALEVLPAKMIEIPIGEFVPFAKVWEDTGYDPGTTAGYSWGKGQYDSEIFQLGRETQGFWDYRYLVGLEVGQESTTVTINNSVQIPLEIVVVENPNYRVHEKEFIVTKKDYSVFLDKMLAYIGYAEKDMEAFTYSGPEHFKVSTESIDFTKKISYLSVFKENAPYDAYFIFKLKDGKSVRLSIHVEEEAEWFQFYSKAAQALFGWVEIPIVLFVMFFLPFSLIALFYLVFGLFLGY